MKEKEKKKLTGPKLCLALFGLSVMWPNDVVLLSSPEVFTLPPLIRAESDRIPHGFRMDSAWIPHGFRSDSAWIPLGFHMDSARIPHGFRSDSARTLLGLFG